MLTDVIEDRVVLHLPGADLEVRVVDGKIEVSCEKGFVLRCGPSRVAVTPTGLEALLGETRYEGEKLVASAKEARVSFGRLEQAVGRLITFAKEMYQRVEGLWHSRAGRIMSEADRAWHLRAGRARVDAEGDVRILGKTINLG